MCGIRLYTSSTDRMSLFISLIQNSSMKGSLTKNI